MNSAVENKMGSALNKDNIKKASAVFQLKPGVNFLRSVKPALPPK